MNKEELYYEPNSKTLREEPQVLTRWQDPMIEVLQQENKQLKKRNKELEDGFKATTDELCEYATKIDKAIEYIKNGADFKSLHFIAGQDEDLWKIILSDNVRKDLLEILGDEE